MLEARQLQQRTWFTHIKHRTLPCTRRTAQKKEFKLIITAKMETRHPIEDYHGSDVEEGLRDAQCHSH